MYRILGHLRGALYSLLHKKRDKYSIGKNLNLMCKLSIKGPGKVFIGNNCLIKNIPGARIKMVTLYTHSQEAVIKIGDNVTLVAARISSRFRIEVGNNVIIEDASLLDTDFHSLDVTRRSPVEETMENCMIQICDGVMIGSRAIISKGVVIGGGTIIHPGSVVQKSFPENCELMGNPAKLLQKK